MFAKFLNALLPIVIGILLLNRPQMFTKKDLTREEHTQIAKRLKTAGIVALFAGVLIFIGSLLSSR